MAFFEVKKRTKSGTNKPRAELLHKAECAACPLNGQTGLAHPNMEPTGSEEPVVYMLGEAPGAVEDAKGRQFVGEAGKTLRTRIPRSWVKDLRWNNCVRTRPPKNKTPTYVEIECCRPSVVKDIEETKPKVIFGFGGVPLQWATGQTGIMKWNGRRLPVQVGSHQCWYFPMLHPSYVNRTRRYEPRDKNSWGSDVEFCFMHDLKKAFKSVDDLPEPVIHTKEYAEKDVTWVTGHENDALEQVIEALEYFSDCKTVGFDWETNARRPYETHSKILSLGLSSKNRTFAFALEHKQAGWSEQELETVKDALERFIHDASCKKISHFLSFELEWAAYFYGVDCVWGSKWEDTACQAWVLDERQRFNKPDCLSLEFLCLMYFGINMKELSNLNRDNLDNENIDDVLRYNAIDAKYHRLLYLIQSKRLKKEDLVDVYQHHVSRVNTMIPTQLNGLPLNEPIIDKLDKKYSKRMRILQRKLAKTPEVKRFERKFNEVFEPSNNNQVKQVLLMNGGFVEKVDEKELSNLKMPFADLELEWRKAAKIHSTYIKPVLPDSPHVFPDGRLHPIISVNSTRTARTSSENPNSQNWPKRDPERKEVRKQIGGVPGFKVVSFDYGQIQARNVAMESLDKRLVKAFWDRYDIHADWVWRIFEKHPEWVKEGKAALSDDKTLFSKYRGDAKNKIVFPSFFGAKAPKISRELDIPLEIAEELSDDFWEMFPNIYDWHQRITRNYHKTGYVTGLSGYRRRAPITPNELINAPIQADEAMIVCDAMKRLSQTGDKRLQASMEIHDDLTFIWPEEAVEDLAPIVIEKMVNVPFEWAHVVPIVVDMSIGDTWYDTSLAENEVGSYSSDTWKGELCLTQ